MTRAGVILLGVIAMAVAGASRPAAVQAAELCRVRSKALIVRDVCKAREQTLGPAEKLDLGLGGKAGASGSHGPASGDLRVLDADGDDVGVVVATQSYYGTATTVGQAMLPNATAAEWIMTRVDGRGLAPSSRCAELPQLYRTSDCQGQAFVRCFNCPPAETLFARDVYRQDANTACYVGDLSEAETGNFFRTVRAIGSTPAQAVQSCSTQGGTVIGTPQVCRPGLFCAQCCRAAEQDVLGVPLHYFDSSILGKPPFRLAR